MPTMMDEQPLSSRRDCGQLTARLSPPKAAIDPVIANASMSQQMTQPDIGKGNNQSLSGENVTFWPGNAKM